MNLPARDLEAAARQDYDLIIAGGGIYGASVALMAALNGKKPLLLDAQDFGAATSFNSLRIVHGGLRYLQQLDLTRFFESVQERRWFFRNYPALTSPIPCLMPIYNQGLKHKQVMQAALLLNDLLSCRRNHRVDSTLHLANGTFVSPATVKQLFPGVDTEGLKGGAIWYDGTVDDSQLVLSDMVNQGRSFGGVAISYCEATALLTESGNTTGVVATDHVTGQSIHFKAPVVINTAGPSSRIVASRFHQDIPTLFNRSLAWNLLFERDAICSHAIALTPRDKGSSTYFLRPWKGRLFAGTVHEACDPHTTSTQPSEASIQTFIEQLNSSIAGLHLKRSDVVRIYTGFMPAREENSRKVSNRPVFVDHHTLGGPTGLFSLSGVKFTTARLEAERALLRIYPELGKSTFVRDLPQPVSDPDPFERLRPLKSFPDAHQLAKLREIIESEGIPHLDDLLFRRTCLGDFPADAHPYALELLSAVAGDEASRETELKRIQAHFDPSASL